MSATASGIDSTAWRQIRISTPAIWSPRSTGSNSAERAPVASTSGGGERRVGAGVGDEVALARGEGAAAVLGLRPRLDRHRGDVDADHRGRDELAARRLEQERDGGGGDLAGRAADGGARVAAAGQRLGDAAERGEPAGVLAQGLGHPLQVARRALALELGRQHAGEHGEQLLVGVGEARRRARQRGEAADARAVRQLERDAEVGDGAELLLDVERRVDRVGGEVVARGAGRGPRPSARSRSRAAASPGWPAGRTARRRAYRRSGARCGRGRGARGTAWRRAGAARAGRARSASRRRTSGTTRSSRPRQPGLLRRPCAPLFSKRTSNGVKPRRKYDPPPCAWPPF